MQPLTQRLSAHLFHRENFVGLLPDESAPDVFLRHALVVQGSERHVFPALLLDDWGRERKTLALYRWIFEEGQRFPRAELFGFDRAGRQTQIFLRDLEIFFKYPCYTVPQQQSPPDVGRRLHGIFVPDADHEGAPEDTPVPQATTWPLRHAALHWWRANPATLADFGWRRAE